MRHGTIVRNLWQPSYKSYLVYLGVSGKYAKCLWIINGEFHGVHDFFKRDILYDREHYPIVGFVDYKKTIIDAVLSNVHEDGE